VKYIGTFMVCSSDALEKSTLEDTKRTVPSVYSYELTSTNA
jgi:hypothetical protein